MPSGVHWKLSRRRSRFAKISSCPVIVRPTASGRQESPTGTPRELILVLLELWDDCSVLPFDNRPRLFDVHIIGMSPQAFKRVEPPFDTACCVRHLCGSILIWWYRRIAPIITKKFYGDVRTRPC
jgi:hypothetical protein